MKLKDYNCVNLIFRCNIPYEKAFWQQIVLMFDRKKGVIKRRKSKSIGVKSILVSSDKKADYHYHFFSERSSTKRLKTIEIEVGLHLNPETFKQEMKKRVIPAIDFETWFPKFLDQKFKEKGLDFHIDSMFVFKKPAFDSVLPVPFKSPFKIHKGKNILGVTSISGLKFRLENSEVGLKTIYFETFPKFIGIRALFKQKIILDKGVIEKFLKSAAEIAALFVKKKEQNDVS